MRKKSEKLKSPKTKNKMNKKHQEQTNIISNLNKIIEDLKSENKKFSGIVEGIELEKESLKNQNTILKSMLSSYNHDLKFTPQTQNTTKLAKFKILKIMKIYFKKFNTLDYKSFDRYFKIMETEYQKIVKNNNSSCLTITSCHPSPCSSCPCQVWYFFTVTNLLFFALSCFPCFALTCLPFWCEAMIFFKSELNVVLLLTFKVSC